MVYIHVNAAPDSTMQTAQEQQQLKNEIQHTIQSAREAARDAARDAAQAQRDAQAAQGDQRIVIRQGVPVPPVPPGFSYSGSGGGFNDNSIPPQAVDLAYGFFVMCAVIVIGWPLARAFGKRIERRAAEPAPASPQLTEQLQRIEQAVDAMSIEIERISESQRFIAKIQSKSAERIG